MSGGGNWNGPGAGERGICCAALGADKSRQRAATMACFLIGRDVLLLWQRLSGSVRSGMRDDCDVIAVTRPGTRSTDASGIGRRRFARLSGENGKEIPLGRVRSPGRSAVGRR